MRDTQARERLSAMRPTYVNTLRISLSRLERQIGRPLETITEQEVKTWYQALEVGPGARVAYAAHLSGFCRWLIRERHRDDDPTVRLDRPRVARRRPRPILDPNLRLAMEFAEPPIRTWLLCASLAGLRACEIAALHSDDIGEALTVVGKGDKQRLIPINARLAAEFVGADGWLFPNRAGDGPIGANQVSKRANRYLHSVGLPETLHQLRHYFITEVYRESQDLRLAQELAGHEDPKTTAGYADWSPERAVLIVGALELPDEAA